MLMSVWMVLTTATGQLTFVSTPKVATCVKRRVALLIVLLGTNLAFNRISV